MFLIICRYLIHCCEWWIQSSSPLKINRRGKMQSKRNWILKCAISILRHTAYGSRRYNYLYLDIHNYISNGAKKPRAKLKWIFEIVCISPSSEWCAIWNDGFDSIESGRRIPLVKYTYYVQITAAAKRFQAEMESINFNIFQQETLQK